MPRKNLTQRVAELEAELGDVKKRLPNIERPVSSPSFVDNFWGVFRDDPAFLEAEKLGREYRESLRSRDKVNRNSVNSAR